MCFTPCMREGPGARMSAPSISWIWPVLTAAIRSQPGRPAMAAESTGLPHHEARMIWGSRSTTASGSILRPVAECWSRSSANTSRPPAISMMSDTQRIPAIAAEGAADQEDRAEDFLERALVGAENRHARADQVADDLTLEIGEGQDQVGLEREDAVELEGGEPAHARLFPRGLGPLRRAGDADDALAGADEKCDLGGLGGETDDASREIVAARAVHPGLSGAYEARAGCGRATAAKWLSSSHPGKARASSRGPSSRTSRERRACSSGRSPSQTRVNAARSAATTRSTPKPGSLRHRSTSSRLTTSQEVAGPRPLGTPRKSNRTTVRPSGSWSTARRRRTFHRSNIASRFSAEARPGIQRWPQAPSSSITPWNSAPAWVRRYSRPRPAGRLSITPTSSR